ncbi:MAG: DUF6252 family protein [Cyclobacteriaceae bacterium]
MKNLLFLFVAGVFLLSGCGSDDDSTPSGSFNVEAKIDGVDWSGAGNTVVTVAAGQTITAVGAGREDGSAFALTFMSGTTGTYDLANFATYVDPARTVYTATSGTITVTEFTESSISGTFSFSASNLAGAGSVEITQGKFTNVNVMR